MEGPKVPSEAREARSAGAPRRWGLGRGAVAPPQYGVWGLCPQKISQKINVEIAHFQAFLQAKNKMVSSAMSARHVRLGTHTNLGLISLVLIWTGKIFTIVSTVCVFLFCLFYNHSDYFVSCFGPVKSLLFC